MTRRDGRHCSAPTACVPRALRNRWDKTGAAKAAADKAAADKAAAEKVAAEKRAAEKVAAERAAAERAAAERAAAMLSLLNSAQGAASEQQDTLRAMLERLGLRFDAPAPEPAPTTALPHRWDKAAADKAAAAKAAADAQQEAEDAQLAAAIAASLAISGPVPPPSPFTRTPPPTSLAASRFMESYNKPESRPDQLYALMTTDCHRLPERRAARYSRIGSS
jgi:hypothetical protein